MTTYRKCDRRARGRSTIPEIPGPEDVRVGHLIAAWRGLNALDIDGMTVGGRRALFRRLQRLDSFWGGMTVADIGADASRQYQIGRNPASARADLSRLRAVVDFGVRAFLLSMVGSAPDYALPPCP